MIFSRIGSSVLKKQIMEDHLVIQMQIYISGGEIFKIEFWMFLYLNDLFV